MRGDGTGTGLLAAGRSSVRALQLYYLGRPVLWWSVEVVVGAFEIVIETYLECADKSQSETKNGR